MDDPLAPTDAPTIYPTVDAALDAFHARRRAIGFVMGGVVLGAFVVEVDGGFGVNYAGVIRGKRRREDRGFHGKL